MSFTPTQSGVAKGALAGLLITAVAFFWPLIPHVGTATDERLSIWLACALLTAFWVLIGVGRLAQHRFRSVKDINAGGLPKNSERAAELQAILQNTLEQAFLAILASGAWLWLGPPDRSGVIIICTALFSFGRLLFFVGYARGASARALGFALTFYPTVALFLATLPHAVVQFVRL